MEYYNVEIKNNLSFKEWDSYMIGFTSLEEAKARKRHWDNNPSFPDLKWESRIVKITKEVIEG